MVFQDFALYPHMSVEENVGFPLRMAASPGADRGPGQRGAHRSASPTYAAGAGPALRRPAPARGHGPGIVRHPKLFLMDEPLSNLDSGLRSELRAEISSLVARSA